VSTLRAAEQEKSDISGLKVDFDRGNGSFLGQPLTNLAKGFIERMGVGEQWLMTQYPGKQPQEIGELLGVRILEEKGSQARSVEKKATSYHGMGWAIDINRYANPRIYHKKKKEGANAKTDERQLWVAWRARWLMGHGALLDPKDLNTAGKESTTRDVWATSHSSSEVVRDYLAITTAQEVTDQIAVQGRTVPFSPPPLDSSPSNSKTVDTAEAKVVEALQTGDGDRWLKQINADRSTMRLTAGSTSLANFGDSGFSSHSLELVTALRDVAGLAWGASDISAADADIMHFDGRTIAAVKAMRDKNKQEAASSSNASGTTNAGGGDSHDHGGH
ncbi:MAG: hypothetical protein KC492_12060, partial [Myxococcales bacterium]|nr:hypothetical protein [Myxococcales bacterium]